MTNSMLLIIAVLSAGSGDVFREDEELWIRMDMLNEELSGRLEIPSDELETLFEEALDIAFESGLEDQLEDLRTDAFMNDDFENANRYIDRAAPAITLIMGGESNRIGINVLFFLEKSPPGTEAHDFFDLASDGFYADMATLTPGTAEMPVWMEQGASSAQAVINAGLAEAYMEIWQALSIGFDGCFLSCARETIRGLGGEPDLSADELQAYRLVYSNPAAVHVRTAISSYLGGSTEGLLTSGTLLSDLERYREYLPDRFVVLSLDRSPMGGTTLLLISGQRPDRIFEAWVYTLADGSYQMRGFTESTLFLPEEISQIADRYRDFLEDEEHSL